MEIIPAIMPQSYEDIANHVARVVDEQVQTAQLDIMDGVFVPARTWPYNGGAGEWEKLQSGDIGLPAWEDIDYELDLMIANPAKNIDEWIALGPKRIILHLESLEDPVSILQQLQDVRTSIEIGLALNNATPLDLLMPHLEVIDCVQLMGIATIGKQGEPFDDRVLEKIQGLRRVAPHIPIQIDGSVNNDTIEMLEQEGIQRVIVGSAFFG